MKKVAIITLHGYYNYGNRWQNYALQEILKDYGFEVETIVAKRRGRILAAKSLYYSLLGKAKGKRYFKIRKFSRKNIAERKLIYKNFAIPKSVADQYEYFVAGSDQIWHPNIDKFERDYFFLSFADRKQRVCVSPSFGVQEIPEQYAEEYKEALNGFERLCSREQAGVRIIEELTGRSAEWIIDPTLAFEKERWSEILPKESAPAKKYVLLAVLGDIDSGRMEHIQENARKNDMEVIDVLRGNVALDPAEMLWYLKHAALVYTDSFHFTAFSINFNKPFVVFRRQGNEYQTTMFSRLNSLLNLFELQERTDDQVSEETMFECDFTRANEVLVSEREKFHRYMEICIKD